MGTAHLVNDNVGGFVGDAKTYRLDPPLPQSVMFVTVVITDKRWGPIEAMVVHAIDRRGAAVTMNRLPGSYVHPEANHAGALFLNGYEIGDDELVDVPTSD